MQIIYHALALYLTRLAVFSTLEVPNHEICACLVYIIMRDYAKWLSMHACNNHVSCLNLLFTICWTALIVHTVKRKMHSCSMAEGLHIGTQCSVSCRKLHYTISLWKPFFVLIQVGPFLRLTSRPPVAGLLHGWFIYTQAHINNLHKSLKIRKSYQPLCNVEMFTLQNVWKSCQSWDKELYQ